MALYVQYDNDGNIIATVRSFGIEAPNFLNQLSLDDETDIRDKMVDVMSKTLIDIT